MIGETISHNCHPEPTHGWRDLFSGVGTLVAAIAKRWQDRRGAASLFVLSDDELKDIGVTRGDVYREASKPLWR
jgi:uncharacterized protein YjiS (DUF1127 family)